MKGVFRTLSILFAALPFGFGSIRAVQTGNDLRYLWVAVAALCGAALVMRVGSVPGTVANRVARSVTAFFASGFLAVLIALLLGTRLGPGILVVASAFGFCFAAATLLYVMSR
jgi:hypothetical protein